MNVFIVLTIMWFVAAVIAFQTDYVITGLVATLVANMWLVGYFLYTGLVENG